MPSLFSTMRSAATALDALQKAASAIQNNVTNASTPGYAKQRAVMSALPYDPAQQLSGGVAMRELLSARDEFSEHAVRQQTSGLGAAEEFAKQISSVESSFSLTNAGGVANRLTELFNAANSWSVAPGSLSEKANVITAAQNLADAFQATARALQESAHEVDARIHSTLDRIGAIAERIRCYNAEVQSSGSANAGTAATAHGDLEELSEFVDFQTLWQKDGSVTVLIGGQTALVIGSRRLGLGASPDSVSPNPGMEGGLSNMEITDACGATVTPTITSGRLGALLQFRNVILPGLAGSMTQVGDLSRLASTVADRINQILTAGDASAPTMFSYTGPGAAAQTLSVSAAMTPASLSAADPTTTPATANGRALQFAALAHPVQAVDEIDSLSYVSFFGQISARVGRTSAEARESVDSRRQLQTLALSAREQISGVSLNEEAVSLVAVQRAYEATSRMISTIDKLTEIAVNTGRN